jgi:solute:Na+ symporter, SSS family
MKVTKSVLIICLLILPFSAWSGAAEKAVPSALREEAVAVLRDALENAESWPKVHAAESLLALGYREGVLETFEKELAEHGEKPQYRIGVSRVFSRGLTVEAPRRAWTEKIARAFRDPAGPDRLHALETLAKLGYTITDAEKPLFLEAAESGDEAMAPFAAWVLINSGEWTEEKLAAYLQAGPEPSRMLAAYALRHLPALSEETAAALVDAARNEAPDSDARLHLVCAAYVHAPDEESAVSFHALLGEYARSGSESEKYQAALALSMRGTDADIPLLRGMLAAEETDARIGAATAILRIGRRAAHSLKMLDWIVLFGYAFVMIGIGWFYSRRVRNSEDYNLGGRTMNPALVGLSLFASLLSTISYLSYPGEMIKHGPMMAAQYLGYPIIFLVVGYILVPYIMRMKVTSAYEILEKRFGLSVRMLGSFYFLALRLMWMSVIIYATGSKILIPLMGWSEAATPLVCAVLGLITVIYTSMGGLRAVVMTDALQTGILFFGAVLTLVMITINLGGVSAWWPTEWSANWDPLKVWYDSSARVTIFGALTAIMTWHICTQGSDQVAIQRYLSTRDVKAARRVILTSLTTGASTGIMLALLGMALFAWFNKNPWMLPDGQQVYTDSDVLFPRFIALGLPAGISGLVIAGLLAAAMSSLSSGVNSASSVISEDFVYRFRRNETAVADQAQLRMNKNISWILGIAVVFMSIGVGQVSGNLLEVAYKVVNLLTAPLFTLFFMAFFIRWGTPLGAWTAGISSAAIAIGIGYFGWFGLSFIWILPGAFLTGAILGPLVSLLPIGPRGREIPL